MIPVLILAAGNGRRMGPIGEAFNKALLPVGLDTLLAHHMRTFAALGTTRFAVVVDHAESAAAGEARRLASELGVRLEVIVQVERRGIGYAVLMAESWLERSPFVLVLGDTYYVPRDLAGALEALKTGPCDVILSVRLMDDDALIRKECTIDLGTDGLVRRIVEKPATVLSRWKPCGVYFFGPALVDALHRTPASALRGEIEITDAIQTVINLGGRVGVRDTLELDVNITWPSDLIDANLALLKSLGRSSLVAATARVADDVTLEWCVVAEGASVGRRVHLIRSVVFPGARVEDGAVLSDALIAPGVGIVDARVFPVPRPPA